MRAFPVMGVGLAWNFESLLICRLLIGVIGAAFVITQYHTSIMFAPNGVGTANATTAGWGNLGGGATQMDMPLIYSMFVGVIGVSAAAGLRLSMIVAGSFLLLTGIAYFFFTQDAPHGNYKDLRTANRMFQVKDTRGTFLEALRDRRVLALAVIYGACFGMELIINNIAVLYFIDYFSFFDEMSASRAMTIAGVFAGLFGLMNIFARTLGGIIADQCGLRWGLRGRVRWLFLALFLQGIALMLFSQMPVLILAVPMLIIFSLVVMMAEGASYAVVPFVNRRALGSVAGIVGAGGNVGAVLWGLFFTGWIPWNTALLILGAIVVVSSGLAFVVRFSPRAEVQARRDLKTQLTAEPVPQPLSAT